MTKKDYEIVAASVAEVLENYGSIETAGSMTRMAIRDVAITLADRFEDENPRFNRKTFLVACGVR